MSTFGKWFGRSEKTSQNDTVSWLELTKVSQLDGIVAQSGQKPQLIFKHSTRCGISRMVKNQFEKDYPLSSLEVDLYYLDLLNYREISNAIASRFKVYHESPQLLVIKDGNVLKHASHGSILDLNLKELL